MNNATLSRTELLRLVLSRYVMGFLALCLLFFLPAGTLDYWEAWVYLAVLFTPMAFALVYLVRNDPELLERRMRMREREREQKLIIRLSYLWFLLAFLLPGLDRRWDWSQVPTALVIVADVLVLLGYGLFLLVLRENSYASRTVQVEQGQRVISSGPYAMVRHPMYTGLIVLYVASPLALGSYWAVLPALVIIPILVARIINEEKVLRRELPGYEEYTRKTVYRLVPGIW
jgi:protein-S-isoprenylcysteine O-methyltransferase Ste14